MDAPNNESIMRPILASALVLSFAVAVPARAETWRGTPTEPAVAATVEWLLLRALADALMERLDVAPSGEGAVSGIGFASTRLAARYDDAEAAARLADIARALQAVRGPDGPPPTEGDAFAVACIANGVDPEAGASLAAEGGFDPALYDSCGAAELDGQTEDWDVALSGVLLFEGEPPSDVPVSVEARGGDAEWLAETGLLEAFAEETAATYAFVEPLPVAVRACGGPGVRHAAGEGISVCVETIDPIARALLAAEGDTGPGDGATSEAGDEDAAGGDAPAGE